MAPPISLEKLSDILELPYVKRDWTAYNLGSGFGRSHFGNASKGSQNTRGGVYNVIGNNKAYRLQNIRLDMDHWSEIHSFFYGILVFCFERIKDKINFVKSDDPKDYAKIRNCVTSLEFPSWSKSLLELVWDRHYDFNDYLDFLNTVDKLNFDLNSAKMVYKLQGDDAIFGILGQIYQKLGEVDFLPVQLIPNLPLLWVPDVSDFVSGCFFPVVVSRFSDDFRWESNENGVFLINEFDEVIDCAMVGQYSCANDCLANRLSFCGSSGFMGGWVICWTWLEIVEAVKDFGSDVLVRNLSENLLGADWHRFGPNGLLTVFSFNGSIGGRGNNLDSTSFSKTIKKPVISELRGDINRKVVVNLVGQLIERSTKELVVYSNDELCDWFELGQLCVEEM